MQTKRINLYKKFRDSATNISDFDKKYPDYSSWESINFKDENSLKELWNKCLRGKDNQNNVLWGDSLENFYKTFACGDLDWAKSTTYCGGSGNSTPSGGGGSTDQNSERQKNINKVYCSLDSNKKVTLTNSKTNGWTWDEFKNTYTVTQSEEDTAKNSCGSSSTTIGGGGTSTKPAVSWTDTNATEQDVANGTLIKKFMKGDIVTKIQNHLIKHGFNNISFSKKADGKFGSRTKKAVMDFQISKGLKSDGVVGPKTWAELIKDKSSVATTTTTTAAPAVGTKTDTSTTFGTSENPTITSGGSGKIDISIDDLTGGSTGTGNNKTDVNLDNLGK